MTSYSGHICLMKLWYCCNRLYFALVKGCLSTKLNRLRPIATTWISALLCWAVNLGNSLPKVIFDTRNGFKGRPDNHFQEKFSNAIRQTMFNNFRALPRGKLMKNWEHQKKYCKSTSLFFFHPRFFFFCCKIVG